MSGLSSTMDSDSESSESELQVDSELSLPPVPQGSGLVGTGLADERSPPLRTPGAAYSMPFADTPYVCLLWATAATRGSGTWQLHIAHRDAPRTPLAVAALQAQGVHVLQLGPGGPCDGGMRWQRDDGDWGDTTTLIAAPGLLIALQIGGKVHGLSTELPFAPEVDLPAHVSGILPFFD
ncbi:hypothetical protein MIND_00818700 [Mycena indigotica]|uniref:Uncharacterized protein n=1 Tax=Mycena indigotica TaxID=2126181 RepID=A0A8H6VYQ6_9AGAR|nr:uncharacterized protein MIND_00818700 [Mycena indigotica]KAF7298712.1 hypothetical protein MIND_00818700 [Mycena indigotica]